jgi:hypothetical protein
MSAGTNAATGTAANEQGQEQRRRDTGVIHDGFTLERSYPVAAARVFGAFASWEAKNVWADTGDIEEAEGDAATVEFDFRPGTRLTVTEQGAYLDGIDGPEANELRREGVTAMIDQLAGYLAAQPNG